MITEKLKTSTYSFALFVITLSASFFLSGKVYAQPPRPPADPRMEDIRRLQENNTLMAGQQKDRAAQIKKEERIAIVNEAFKRLQVLHNEMMTIMSAGKPVDDARIKALGEETKLRAMELDANLALPPLPEEKKKKGVSEKQVEIPATLTDRLNSICVQIREFVRNVNQSPNDPKAGQQARRDLVSLIEKGDSLILLVSSPSKN